MATTHKRKRDASVSEYAQMASQPNNAQAFDTQYLHDETPEGLSLAAALTQHNAAGLHGDSNGQSATDTASAALHYSMTVPTPTEQQFLAQTASETNNDRESGTPFDLGSSTGAQQDPNAFSEFSEIEQLKDDTPTQQAQGAATQGSPTSTMPKPLVGTDEWNSLRKNNHKEVERRRRETINEGINELSKIVPGCEKNKGSILAKAVQFITQLKENESQNIEKWTLEKLLTEQAIGELSSSCDKLKAEKQKAVKERNAWIRAGKRLGFEPNEEDRSAADTTNGDEDS